MKFCIKDFFSTCGQIRYLVTFAKNSMENFIFCAVTSKGPYFLKACENNFRLIFSSQTEWQALFLVLVSFTLITTNSFLCWSSYHMFLSQIVTFD